jgi:hypothetical protein
MSVRRRQNARSHVYYYINYTNKNILYMILYIMTSSYCIDQCVVYRNAHKLK